MADQVSAARQQRNLASYHRRVAERIAQGMSPKCGQRPPAPDRRQCEPCAEKARGAECIRAERLQTDGKPVRDPEAAPGRPRAWLPAPCRTPGRRPLRGLRGSRDRRDGVLQPLRHRYVRALNA